LRFDWGRLMIHEGRVGRPDVTLWGSAESILALGVRARPWRRWRPEAITADTGSPELGAPPAERAASVKMHSSWTRVLRHGTRTSRRELPKDVKIYGLGSHPRFVWRLARLLAPT